MIDAGTAARDGDYREECLAMLAGVIGRMCRRRGSMDDIEAALIEGAIAAAWEACGNGADLGTVRTHLEDRGDARAADMATRFPMMHVARLVCRTVSSRSSTLFRVAPGKRLGPGITLVAVALTTDGSVSLATDIRGIVNPSPCRADESVACFCQGNHFKVTPPGTVMGLR